MHVNLEMAVEIVVEMFSRLGLRYILLTRQGRLQGILTKMVSLRSILFPSFFTIVAEMEGVLLEYQIGSALSLAIKGQRHASASNEIEINFSSSMIFSFFHLFLSVA